MRNICRKHRESKGIEKIDINLNSNHEDFLVDLGDTLIPPLRFRGPFLSISLSSLSLPSSVGFLDVSRCCRSVGFTSACAVTRT